MPERIIVTLTTWSKRIGNIPTVLDTIFAQTRNPDLVVLNLAYEEVIPEEVQSYLEKHSVEVNRVKDTKVYKKLIPTIRKYPNDCVISIDDDWLYPEGMIEDFMDIHKRYPDNPISGNKSVVEGIPCHCGCASLTKASYFGKYLDMMDDDLMENCPSDDLVYSYMAVLKGKPYYRTMGEYYINMKPYCPNEGYSENDPWGAIYKTLEYMEKRFGKLPRIIPLYLSDKYVGKLIDEISAGSIRYYVSRKELETEERISSTYSFRIGQAIVKPFRWMKKRIIK
jgi:hypothetical protein